MDHKKLENIVSLLMCCFLSLVEKKSDNFVFSFRFKKSRCYLLHEFFAANALFHKSIA